MNSRNCKGRYSMGFVRWLKRAAGLDSNHQIRERARGGEECKPSEAPVDAADDERERQELRDQLRWMDEEAELYRRRLARRPH
jgi:hypothetical protein